MNWFSSKSQEGNLFYHYIYKLLLIHERNSPVYHRKLVGNPNYEQTVVSSLSSLNAINAKLDSSYIFKTNIHIQVYLSNNLTDERMVMTLPVFKQYDCQR